MASLYENLGDIPRLERYIPTLELYVGVKFQYNIQHFIFIIQLTDKLLTMMET